MDKNTRNLLICCVVSSLVGIIMGVGLVAPSIKQPVGIGEHQMIINTNTPETMELCIDWSMELQGQFDECQSNINILQGQFNQCIVESQTAQELAHRSIENSELSTELLDRCIEALKRK